MDAERTAYQPPDINTVEALTARLLDRGQELEEANRKLREAELARDEMLANLSHDLRAPATAIRSAIDRLKYGQCLTPQEVQSMVEILDRRAAALEHLIRELYYLVTIDRPGYEPHAVPLDIAPMLEEYWVTQRWRDDLGQRRLRLDVPEGFSAAVRADPNHLVSMLDNLLENALRFTGPRGSVTIGCRPSPEQGFVELFVIDDGCGIEPQHLERIFDRTYTVSQARGQSEKGGTGLGLSIVRRLAQLNGGQVWCKSRPGAGSAFFIRLATADPS